jgi:hypothetical protein
MSANKLRLPTPRSTHVAATVNEAIAQTFRINYSRINKLIKLKHWLERKIIL